MKQPIISGSSRIRRTPYSKRVEEAGVKSYSVYNHMLLPTVFDTLENDYHHLKRAVQVWDVSVERQIEIIGPDATIPEDKDPSEITMEEALILIEKRKEYDKSKKKRKK